MYISRHEERLTMPAYTHSICSAYISACHVHWRRRRWCRAYGAELDLSRALVIGVSQSGKAADVISVIERAKKCGAPTVALTNDPSSPLSEIADYKLDCGAGPEHSIAATKTLTAQMYVLATLCARWAQRFGKVPPESTGVSSAEELLAALDKLPDAVEKLLETVPAQIEAIIPRYRYLENAFVLARGITYPIAYEGALKILETNRIKVSGYAISDFYHGPLAQVGAGTLVIVLAARGKLLGDASDMMLRIQNLGVHGRRYSCDYGRRRHSGQMGPCDKDSGCPGNGLNFAVFVCDYTAAYCA